MFLHVIRSYVQPQINYAYPMSPFLPRLGALILAHTSNKPTIYSHPVGDNPYEHQQIRPPICWFECIYFELCLCYKAIRVIPICVCMSTKHVILSCDAHFVYMLIHPYRIHIVCILLWHILTQSYLAHFVLPYILLCFDRSTPFAFHLRWDTEVLAVQRSGRRGSLI